MPPIPPRLQRAASPQTTPSARPLPELPPPSAAKHSSSIPIPSHSRKARAPPRLEPVVEGDARFLREVRQPPPGDSSSASATAIQGEDVRRRQTSSPSLSKQRSLYFEQAFGSERTEEVDQIAQGPRDRATVLAEVKTNVFVADEMAFMTNLTQHLSTRYKRPISSIAVSLQHGACLLVGGTLEPAYSIAIHALSSLFAGQVATNKRNAALLQRHLGESLGVPSGRGLVRFVGVPEACLARGGQTVAGEMAEKRQRLSEDSEGGKIQRKRTVRAFSKLKHSAPNISQNPPSPTTRSTMSPTFTSNDTSLESSASQHASHSSPRRSTGDQTVPARSRSLRHRPSLKFIQSFFSRTTKSDSQPAEAGNRDE